MDKPTGAISISIAVILIALLGAKLAKQYDGGAEQSCPAMNNTEYMFLGKSAEEGEACGYLMGGAAPRCVNTALHMPNRDNEERADKGDLACFRNICTKLLSEKEDCSVGNSTMPAACESGVCDATTRTCIETHGTPNGATCISPHDCAESHTCFNATCVERTQPNAMCDTIDDLLTLPGPYESYECTPGYYCTQYHNGKRCITRAFGKPGSPCEWNSTAGETRPGCLRGHAYCTPEGRCEELGNEGEACSYRAGEGIEQNGQPCGYGLSCHPTHALNMTLEWVPGSCQKLYSLPAGQPAHVEDFCELGLYLDAAGVCMEVEKLGQSCNATEQCVSSADEVGRVSCLCTKANDMGSPGVCKKTPVAAPLLPDIRFIDECRTQFTELQIYKAQFYKNLDGDEDARAAYEKKASELLQRGYCCLRRHVRSTSHLHYLTGLFAIDLDRAELRCNTDLIWLWVCLAVLGFAICLGSCVMVINFISTDEEDSSSNASDRFSLATSRAADGDLLATPKEKHAGEKGEEVVGIVSPSFPFVVSGGAHSLSTAPCTQSSQDRIE